MRTLFACFMVLFCMSIAGQELKSHTVQRGETIENIAAKYNVSVADIKKANPNIGDLFYTGLKIKIPTTSVIQPVYFQNNDKNQKPKSRVNQKTNDMSERITSTYEVDYSASTFDDIQLSGSYGLSMTLLPWKIIENLYCGFRFSPFHFNFGLVDSNLSSDLITFGPALGYYFTPTIFLTFPVELTCNIRFEGSDSKTSWGMAFTPSLYLGTNKYGIFVGPMFSFPFVEGGTEISTGFRAGIYF